jgi:YD repeat-containing protein
VIHEANRPRAGTHRDVVFAMGRHAAKSFDSDFANGATTTFGYDAFGARVSQIASTTASSTYPFKWFSIASITRGSTNYATSAEYIFNGVEPGIQSDL